MAHLILRDTLLQEMQAYAGDALNGKSYLMQDDTGTVLSVLAEGVFNGESVRFVALFVRLVDDLIVIDTDRNDKPLVDALVQAGIPREQIVLAYAGESLPENVDM
jgi:hypothetical protein